MNDNEIRKFISKLRSDLIKEKTQALDFLRKVEYEKQASRSNLEKELKAVNFREQKLRQVLVDSDKKLQLLAVRNSKLKLVRKRQKSQVPKLKKQIKKLQFSAKNLSLLKHKIVSLDAMKSEKKILKIKFDKRVQALQARSKKLNIEIFSKELKSMAFKERKLKQMFDSAARNLKISKLGKGLSAIGKVQERHKKLRDEIRVLRDEKRKKMVARARLRQQQVVLRAELVKLRSFIAIANKQIVPLQKRIGILTRKRSSLANKKRILNSLVKKMERISEDIHKSHKVEKNLANKKVEILSLRRELSKERDNKKVQKQKVIFALRALRDQESQIKKFEL